MPTTRADHECQHCTVPTAPGELLCTFCRDYTPPTDKDAADQPTTAVEPTPVTLDEVRDHLDTLRADLDAALAGLDRTATPILMMQAITAALTHLRLAGDRLDGAADMNDPIGTR